MRIVDRDTQYFHIFNFLLPPPFRDEGNMKESAGVRSPLNIHFFKSDIFKFNSFKTLFFGDFTFKFNVNLKNLLVVYHPV